MALVASNALISGSECPIRVERKTMCSKKGRTRLLMFCWNFLWSGDVFYEIGGMAPQIALTSPCGHIQWAEEIIRN